MQTAAPAFATIDLRTLLLSAAAGGTIGIVPLILGLAEPSHLMVAAMAAIGGALVTRSLQPPVRRIPPAEVLPPAAIPAAVPLTPSPDGSSGTPEPVAEAQRAAAVAQDLADLDPYFSVTREQLRSIVAQTEGAAAAIMESLQALGAAQARSATCIGGTHDRIVGFAEQSDAALQGLAASLGTYLDHRLSETREERSTVDAATEQMRALDALIVTLEKVGGATRMLALNANIEAGRAGIHGAGFKVIARELQDLAQTSQAAMAEARLQVSHVQRTIGAVLIADRGDDATRTEQARLQALMADLDGIARTTTQVLLGMARSELTEVKDLTAAVGEQVLSVFGQVQFQDVVRQQIEAVDASTAMLRACLGGLRQGLGWDEPEGAVRPAEILKAARARYVTQIQHAVDARALGQEAAGAEAPDIELF
ncbi:MAG: hypothetical protein INR70_24050 [Parafilimonas terrae]|nr:hypothetical protein [Parafilimonas terrae]